MNDCMYSYCADYQGLSDTVPRDPRLDCWVPSEQPRNDSDNGGKEHAHWTGEPTVTNTPPVCLSLAIHTHLYVYECVCVCMYTHVCFLAYINMMCGSDCVYVSLFIAFMC